MAQPRKDVVLIDPSALCLKRETEACVLFQATSRSGSSVVDGIRLVEQRTPDALVVARSLPGLPGESLVASLRASPKHEHIPIAIVTSDDWVEPAVKASHPDRIIVRDGQFSSSMSEFLEHAFEAPDASSFQRELEEPAGAAASLEGKRILVVDDMESMRRLLCALLVRNGAEVDQAGDGLDAIEMIIGQRSARPDLVLMDYEMPRVGGVEALERLRFGGFDGPIVACSGHDGADFRRGAMEIGFTDVIEKASAPKQLSTICLRALGAA